jgi:hypothetical protein
LSSVSRHCGGKTDEKKTSQELRLDGRCRPLAAAADMATAIGDEETYAALGQKAESLFSRERQNGPQTSLLFASTTAQNSCPTTANAAPVTSPGDLRGPREKQAVVNPDHEVINPAMGLGR